ncbi:MAG TPA: PQQ-binding-like beta-propeller repeat protein [Candidatus Baltobacteraceae bacterium]|nr:PQQ-binding-like beta-propeller repeat protein [Candidatus Baltobacteraceae bacterium]
MLVQAVALAAMFRCDAAHTGICAPAQMRDTLQPRWRLFTGNLNRSTPAYADGLVYVGSNNGNLYALDAASGHVRWQFHARGPVNSSAAVNGGVVYFADDRAQSGVSRHEDGFARRLQSQTAWFTRGASTGTCTRRPQRLVCCAGVSKRKIRIRGFRSEKCGYFYALNAQTGKTVRSRGENGSWVISSAAVATGVAYYGTSDGQLIRALDEKTGVQRWLLRRGALGFTRSRDRLSEMACCSTQATTALSTL